MLFITKQIEGIIRGGFTQKKKEFQRKIIFQYSFLNRIIYSYAPFHK